MLIFANQRVLAAIPVPNAIAPYYRNRVAYLPPDILHRLGNAGELQLRIGIDLIPVACQRSLIPEQDGVLHLRSKHDNAVGLVVGARVSLQENGESVMARLHFGRKTEQTPYLIVHTGIPRQNPLSVRAFPP